ncbi:hypothetical protein BDC45DRAFT_536145 [Circinella umbellata]|nr:hypothetical protein BDC45DRAFT_536145 [Circinella umbellata]
MSFSRGFFEVDMYVYRYILNSLILGNTLARVFVGSRGNASVRHKTLYGRLLDKKLLLATVRNAMRYFMLIIMTRLFIPKPERVSFPMVGDGSQRHAILHADRHDSAFYSKT